MGISDHDLTPFERELQLPGGIAGRGHTPVDDVTEPAVAPSDPASASNAPAHEALSAPEPVAQSSDDE